MTREFIIKRIDELFEERSLLKWYQILRREKIDIMISAFMQSYPYAEAKDD